MKVSRAAVATVAACLTVGLAGATPAMAAKADGSAKANAAASTPSNKTLNKRLNATRKQLRSTSRQAASARRSARKVSTDLGALAARVKNTEGGLGTILAAAPQLITGLQTLADAVQTKIAPGLQALSDAVQGKIAPGLAKLAEVVEKQIGPGLQELAAVVKDTIGPGLKRVGDFLAAPEYGIAQMVIANQNGPQPQTGSFVVTPDLPDTVQQAMTTQQFVAQHSGVLIALYGVRSGENDGDGTTPAAHCRVTLTNESKSPDNDATNVNQNTQTTQGPGPGPGPLGFLPVETKSALTSTDPTNSAFPFGLKQNGDDKDNTKTFQSTLPVTQGDTYTVGLSCVDISPNANDPKA